MLELLEEIAIKDAFENAKQKRNRPKKKVARSFLGFGRKKKTLSDEESDDVMVKGEANELNKSESDDLMVSDAETEEWAPGNVAYNDTDLNNKYGLDLISGDEE